MQMVRGESRRSCQTGAMQLTKHHGLGNDFLIALADALPAEAPAVAREVCHRTRGVGADGLIFGLPGDPGAGTDVTMVLFNADGSRAEMSGNGVRCLAQAIVRREGHGAELRIGTDAGVRQVVERQVDRRHGAELQIGTDAGVRCVQVEITDDSSVIEAHVDMGPIGRGPELGGIDYPDGLRFATADVGNPHLVILVDDASTVDVAQHGAELTQLAGGINVEFISPSADGGGIDLRVWERGVGVTRACGTGACAAAQTAHHWGLAGPVVSVSMPGGEVVVELGDTAVLIGPAAYIATVEYG